MILNWIFYNECCLYNNCYRERDTAEYISNCDQGIKSFYYRYVITEECKYIENVH